MSKAVFSALSILGIVAWGGFVVLEYLSQHPWYPEAFSYFVYYDIALILLGGAAAFTYVYRQPKFQTKIARYANGLGLFALSWVLVLISNVSFFSRFEFLKLGGDAIASLTFNYVGVALACWLVIGCCYVLGDLLWKYFPAKGSILEMRLLKISGGMMTVVLIVFLLGTVNLLHPIILGAALVLPLALNRQGSKAFFKFTLLSPLKMPKELNAVGIFSFALLALFVSLNFVQIIRPIPLGFDAAALYARLPALIDGYQGLVQGHGAYNWSLFMSLGLILFDHMEVVFALSFIGGFLSLFGLYALSRRWMGINHAFLALFGYYSIPLLTFQSTQDMKIDLGLLFISISLLILLVNWGNSKSKDTLSLKGPNFKMLVWMGLLTGFAFGIKFTALMLLLSLLAGIWYSRDQFIGFVGAICFMLFVVLLLRLDEKAALRSLHSGVDAVQWTLAGAGLALIGWQAFKNRGPTLHKVKMTAVVVAFFLLAMTPWFVKNVTETGSVGVNDLLNGKKALPEISIQSLENNYNKLQLK